MRIDLFADARSYDGYEYYYDTEAKKYYADEYMWHIDDSQEVLGTSEISAEWVMKRLKEDEPHLFALARVNQYCGIDTTDIIMEKIKAGEDRRKKYWEKTADDAGLFTLKRTKMFEHQTKPGDFRRIRNKIKKHFALEFLICNDPLVLLSAVFDENGCFLYYELIWYICQKEKMRIDLETETKFLLYKREVDPASFRITDKLMDVLCVNSRRFLRSEAIKRIKDLQTRFSNLTEKSYFDILMR